LRVNHCQASGRKRTRRWSPTTTGDPSTHRNWHHHPAATRQCRWRAHGLRTAPRRGHRRQTSGLPYRPDDWGEGGFRRAPVGWLGARAAWPL